MAPARPIVFLTDFGVDDFYAGVMRAVAASVSPTSRLIDLSHGIAAHAIAQASFVLGRTLDYLPLEAVVVTVVDPGVGGERRSIAVEARGRVLVGPDNGFVSDLAASGSVDRVVALDPVAAAGAGRRAPRGRTFQGRDVFAPVAAAIARGAAMDDFGPEVEDAVRLAGVPSVSVADGRVQGCGRYLDRFGNVLSDIPRDALEREFGDRLSEAVVTVGGRAVGALRRTYADGKPGELIGLLDSWDVVEAAVSGARASDLLGARRPEDVRFELCGA